ncbi:helix-turn-helix domain-containing protein [Mesoterricola sediminis]|uniref:HTH cro/C1-type domain-containing protein n=1 Tax=Mesoterricola sediminis TaxID=2927980 RepID=A0AA48GTS6_9BACT|nr:helix-turn-helix domain-containing protein [Mesoterricola sediminis]BDU77472.1 hypothetical protein METESE_24300 [Mesoterricola sediminis]
MTRLGEAKCREILEVDASAGLEEIRRAHAFLRALYGGGDSPFPMPSMDEFSPEARARVLEEVEAAFQELCSLVEPAPPPPPAARPRAPEPRGILDGPALRALRESQGLTLEHLAQETSIRIPFLAALEAERFQDLPGAAVIVRGYLTAYLAALGVDAEATVADYARRCQAAQGRRP